VEKMDFNGFIISLGSGIIIILIGIISYFVKKDFNRIEKELKEKRDSKLCKAIHQTTDEKVIRRINELDVKITKDFLARLDLNLGFKKSPSQPNEAGKKLLQESGWNKIYRDIKEEVFNWIDKENPKTLYDAEKSAFYVLYVNQDDERFNGLKEYVINNTEEMELDSIFLVASWIIRDEYWELKKSKTQWENQPKKSF